MESTVGLGSTFEFSMEVFYPVDINQDIVSATNIESQSEDSEDLNLLHTDNIVRF